MTISTLETKLQKLSDTTEGIEIAIVDDYNSYEAAIYIDVDTKNLRKMTNTIKKFFKNTFDCKLQLNYDKDMKAYFFDFYYQNYAAQETNIDLEDVLVYSMKFNKNGMYEGNKNFSENIIETSSIAKNKQEHIELLENIYPDYTILPMYSFEHGAGCYSLDFEPNQTYYGFDSSEDAFVAYKNVEKMETVVREINNSFR